MTRETPKFHYDMTFDMHVLQSARQAASFLDSGYRSSTAASTDTPLVSRTAVSISTQPPSASTLASSNYATAWMIGDDLSDDGVGDEQDWGE